MTYKNLSLFFLLFVCGCSVFRSAPQTAYFDLGNSGIPESKNYGFDIKNFSSDLPASTKMIFRRDSNEIEYDVYNNWAQTPQNLLTKYFIFYFNNPHNQLESKYANKKLTIEGDLYNFECNMDTKEAVLSVRIKIIHNETIILSKIYSVKEKMLMLTASDFSKAMAKAILKLAQQVEKDIENIAK